MEDKSLSQSLNDIFEKIRTYIQLKLEYFSLVLGGHIIHFLSGILTIMILFWTGVFVVLFLSGALVAWIGQQTGNWPLAILSGAGIFFVIGLLIFLLRKPLIFRPLNKMYIKLLDLDKKEESHG